MDLIKLNTEYNGLIDQISSVYLSGKYKASAAINNAMLETYWKIGQYIVEFEQGGRVKAQYGEGLLENLSKDLVLLHGKGFSVSNMQRMRQFYSAYPIYATVSHKLSWSMYVELLKISDPLERSFYEKQSILENWNVRELIRQKKSSLFLRLAASQDKDGILKLAEKRKLIEKQLSPSDDEE